MRDRDQEVMCGMAVSVKAKAAVNHFRIVPYLHRNK